MKYLEDRTIFCRKIFENNQRRFVLTGISPQYPRQRSCRPFFVLFAARTQVAGAGGTTDHQNARSQKARECFSDKIDNRTNFPRDAFDEILPDEEHRLYCANIASILLEKQIMMLETYY